MDRLSKSRRSENMRRVRSRNTTPELKVRRILAELGLPYSCYNRELPGNPDLIIEKYRTVIFVHGCFWHGHSCARGARPATNKNFWNVKLDANVKRDRRVKRKLRAEGWHVFTIWQCRLKNEDAVRRRLARIRNFDRQSPA